MPIRKDKPIIDAELQQIHTKIRTMQSIAEELRSISEQFPALNRNIRRIQASLQMLEIDICDPVELESRTAE